MSQVNSVFPPDIDKKMILGVGTVFIDRILNGPAKRTSSYTFDYLNWYTATPEAHEVPVWYNLYQLLSLVLGEVNNPIPDNKWNNIERQEWACIGHRLCQDLMYEVCIKELKKFDYLDMSTLDDWKKIDFTRVTTDPYPEPESIKWIRHRFHEEDARPVIWPAPGPSWCSGSGYRTNPETGEEEDADIVIAILPEGTNIAKYWPKAGDFSFSDPSPLTFGSRFSRPEWCDDFEDWNYRAWGARPIWMFYPYEQGWHDEQIMKTLAPGELATRAWKTKIVTPKNPYIDPVMVWAI